MKIRLEGSKQEVENAINFLKDKGAEFVELPSKFYPNREDSARVLNGLHSGNGRVYADVTFPV